MNTNTTPPPSGLASPSCSAFRVGQQLFAVLVSDSGSCEMQTWEVRTVRGGNVTAIQRNPWTWVKLSTKHGHWGWAKNIDSIWRKTWKQNQNPDHLSRTKKAAWKSLLKSRLNYVEPEAAEKARATARRKYKPNDKMRNPQP